MTADDTFHLHVERLVQSLKASAQPDVITQHVEPVLLHRTTFDLFLKTRLQVLETSFGFGIFALYTLCHNSQIKYIGIDPLKETHQQIIADYLAKEFKERFLLIKGHPSAILPALAIEERKQAIDAFFINAHQSPSDCFTDIANAIRISTPQSLMLIDASKPENTLPPYQSIAKKGRLKPISFKEHKLPDHPQMKIMSHIYGTGNGKLLM
jgi:hypothetical protein